MQGGEIISTEYIGLCGGLSLDLAVYLGQSLLNFQKKILIADLTESQGLQYLFSLSENIPFTYRGIDYMNHDFHVYSEENEKYDFIFVCFEGNIRRFTGNRLSRLYFISDIEISNFRNLIFKIRECRSLTGIILRDIPEEGISVCDLLKFRMQDDFMLKLYEEKRIMELHEDSMDRMSRILLQYSARSNFKELSQEYTGLLIKLVEEIMGCGRKSALQAVKYAKEGKIIEKYNILEQCGRKKWYQR